MSERGKNEEFTCSGGCVTGEHKCKRGMCGRKPRVQRQGSKNVEKRTRGVGGRGGEEQYETSVSVIMGVENGPKSRKNKQKTKNKIKTNENV